MTAPADRRQVADQRQNLATAGSSSMMTEPGLHWVRVQNTQLSPPLSSRHATFRGWSRLGKTELGRTAGWLQSSEEKNVAKGMILSNEMQRFWLK